MASPSAPPPDYGNVMSGFGAPPQDNDLWECPACTFINTPDLKSCGMCQRTKPSQSEDSLLLEVRFLLGAPIDVKLKKNSTVRLLKLKIEAFNPAFKPWEQNVLLNGRSLNDHEIISEIKDLRYGTFVLCVRKVAYDAPPAYQPAAAQTVICPTCEVLISVADGMLTFRCPRCNTTCRAPPKAAPPLAASSMNGPPGGAPPPAYTAITPPPPLSPLNSSPPNNNMMPVLQMQQSAPLPPTIGADNIIPGSTVRDGLITTTTTTVVTTSNKGNVVVGIGPAEDSFVSSRRLHYLHYPQGVDAFFWRSFFISQIPGFNFFWWMFLALVPPVTRRPYRRGGAEEWYDTTMAYFGLFTGFVVFVIWFPIFIKFGALRLVSFALMGALFGIYFGSLCCLMLCWSPDGWGGGNNCYCGGAYGGNGGGCDCCSCCYYCCSFGCDQNPNSCCKNCNNCNCDCGQGCGDCGSCDCGSCNCGSCNCSGCDCGGCDC